MNKRLGTTVVSEPVPLASAEEEERRRWHLWVAHSPDGTMAGQVFPLTSRTAHIGRDPRPGPYIALAVDDERVSRLHASVEVEEGGGPVISDCRSSNGLRVDGRRVDRAALATGAVVRVGDTVLVVERGAPAPAADAAALAMVGRSPAMAALRTVVRRVAPSALPVLVEGETGTGKELVARAVHQMSGRSGAFVPINCAALPAPLVESLLFGHRRGAYTGATVDQDGAFVRADGGTLFLDEIGELPLEAQPKLLRVLEDGEVLPVGAGRPLRVDLRIVAATNVPVSTAVAGGRFREDLQARLAGVSIAAPPLRARRPDILPLFHHFLPAPLRSRPLGADFAEALLLDPWPQNVRALHKLAERLAVLHPDAARWETAMLDPPGRDHAGADDEDHAAEEGGSRAPGPPTRDELLALLARFGGNVSRLAAFVGRSRKQVYRWMDDLAIDRGAGR